MSNLIFIEDLGWSNPYRLDFDGSNDYLQCETDFGLIDDQAYTFAYWLKRKSTGGSDFLWNNRQTSGTLDGFFINFNPSDFFQIYIRDKTSGILNVRTSGTYTDTTNIKLLMVTYDGSETAAGVAIYIDNVSQALTTVTDTLGATGYSDIQQLRLGAALNGAAPADIELDEAYMWTKVLSAGERTTVYNGGTPGDVSSTTPFIWLTFDQVDKDANDPAPVVDGIANQGSRANSAFSMLPDMTTSDFLSN